jgi:hypothetical protein
MADDGLEKLRKMDERRDRIKERFCRAVNLFRHDRALEGSQDLWDAISLTLGYYRDHGDMHKQVIDRLDRIEAALAALSKGP